MIWVVDSNDVQRMSDCREELHSLLQEEVCLKSLSSPTDDKHTLN